MPCHDYRPALWGQQTVFEEGAAGTLRQFFDYAEDIDLIFLGSSHVFDAMFPMELYENYGICSYNLAMSAGTIPLSYHVVRNVLGYQQPKAIVLDCYRLDFPDLLDSYVSAAGFFDLLPFSRQKLSSAKDLKPALSDEEYKALIFPFFNYHNRWSELESSDFSLEPSLLKGAKYYTNSYAGELSPSVSDAALDMPEDAPGPVYIEKLAQLCREQGIELILCHVPYTDEGREAMEAVSTARLAEQLGLRYINFMELDCIDYSTDFFDAGAHLNVSGGKKLSEALGRFFKEELGLADHRGKPGYEDWDSDLAQYLELKPQLLAESNFLGDYLVQLQDKDISSFIMLDEGSCVYDDGHFKALIKNAAGQELPLLEQSWADKTSYALLIDRATGSVQEYAGKDIPEDIGSSAGLIQPLPLPQIQDKDGAFPEGCQKQLMSIFWSKHDSASPIWRSFAMIDGQFVREL